MNIKEKQTVFTWYRKLTYLRISSLISCFVFHSGGVKTMKQHFIWDMYQKLIILRNRP